MAYVQITEFEGASQTADGDPVATQTVNIGVVSTDSNPISGSGRKRRRVRLKAVGADACVSWGASPTAQADGSDGVHLGDGNPEYFSIEAGHVVAVIQAT